MPKRKEMLRILTELNKDMTRFKISICILAGMIILSIFSGVWINSKCNRILEVIETIESSDKESALESSKELEKIWKNFRKYAAVIIKNDKLSEIERIDSRIMYLIQDGSDEIGADLAELKQMVLMLRDGEKPLLTSVF